MTHVEGVFKSMLVIVGAELLRRLAQACYLRWVELTTNYKSRDGNFVLNNALVVTFMGLGAVVTYMTDEIARRDVFSLIIIQSLVFSVPYCLFVHPKLIMEGKHEIFEANSIGAALARQFFSFVENAVLIVGTDQDPLNQSHFKVVRRCQKWVILCPS